MGFPNAPSARPTPNPSPQAGRGAKSVTPVGYGSLPACGEGWGGGAQRAQRSIHEYTIPQERITP